MSATKDATLSDFRDWLASISDDRLAEEARFWRGAATYFEAVGDEAAKRRRRAALAKAGA